MKRSGCSSYTPAAGKPGRKIQFLALALFACVGASAEALDRAPVRTGRGKQLVGPAVSVRLVAKHPPLTFTDTSTTLPLSDATAFVAGETFLVEVWAQTTHPSGLSAVSLDIQFDPLEVAVVLPGTPPFSAGIFHGLLFTGLTNGTADNVAGIVDDLSGSYVPGAGCAASPVGDGPINWVRVAIVEMQALVDGSPMIAPGPTGNPVFGTAACGLANSPESDITYTMINPPSVDFHLNVAAGSSNVQQGDNVTVTFEATNMNVLVNAVQGLLHYDNTMLTLTGITPFDLGLAPPANGWVEINETDLSGDVAYAAFITNGSVNADGVVGTLTLTATGVGTTSLSFLPDHPISFPTLINKATAAATAASIVPNTFGSGVITIGACDDGLTCTTDTFDGTNCVFTVNAGSCLIGGVCYNQGDSNPANGCEECNAAANNIDWTARVNGAPCNDANACTTGDTCSLGICVGGAPPNCNDGNVCTDDSCDPATGCVNTNNAAPCDDANACTTGDTCSLGICVGGAPPNCNDGNVCTDDSCDPATGCVNTNNAAPCDDGLFCTSADVCVGGVCTGGGATNCSDADACTVDTCDEVADVCVNTAAGQVDVTVQAEALGFPVTRTVVCELSDCFGFVDVRAEPVVFDATGAGFVSLLGVPSNVSFIRVSEGHTLARTLPVSFAAACTVPVDLSGANQLLAGDFSNAFVPQDNLVDINDFSILAIAWNQTIDPNADFGADATGDGIQDVADFSAISANFAKVGDLPTNCVITASSAGDPGFPVASEFAQVSIDAAAFPQGQYADLNGDGVIDGQDMRLFVDRYGIPKTAPVRGLLRQLGVSEPGLPRAGAPSSIGRGRR